MSFFALSSISGAVDMGVDKALQAVSVFEAAVIAFCSADNPRACLSLVKFKSLILVFMGVLLYGYGGDCWGIQEWQHATVGISVFGDSAT